MNVTETTVNTYENAKYCLINVVVGLSFCAATLFVGGFVTGFLGLPGVYSYVFAMWLYFPLASYVVGDYTRAFYTIRVNPNE